MARAASLLLRVVGLTLVLVGLMGFALLGFDGTWTARSAIPAGRTAVLLEPSVVSVLGPRVTVRVEPVDAPDTSDTAARTELFLGRGRSGDLTSYAQDPMVSRVVGLSRPRELRVRQGPDPVAARPGDEAAAVAPTATNLPARWRPPTAVDLWHEQVSGAGTRELTWRPTPGAQSIVVAAEQPVPLPALDLEVSWTNHAWLWIPTLALLLGLALIVGGVLTAGGLPAWATRRPRPVAPAGAPHAAPSGGVSVAPSTVRPAAAPRAVRAAAPGARSAAAAAAAAATPTGESPGVPGDGASMGQPVTRRAARGRRRKPTVWDRARSRAGAVAPAATPATGAPGSGDPERPASGKGRS